MSEQEKKSCCPDSPDEKPVEPADNGSCSATNKQKDEWEPMAFSEGRGGYYEIDLGSGYRMVLSIADASQEIRGVSVLLSREEDHFLREIADVVPYVDRSSSGEAHVTFVTTVKEGELKDKRKKKA